MNNSLKLKKNIIMDHLTKVKIKNIKTGQIRMIAASAWKILRKANGLKQYDLIEEPKKVEGKPKAKATPAPKVEPKEEPKENAVPVVDTNKDGKRSAKEVISAISKAKTKAAVKTLIDGESRTSVLQAAQKKNSQLKK